MDQVPPELIYQKTIINGEMATMIFDYKGNSFDIVQTTKDSENSVNIISDRKFKEKEDVYNKWLNREVEIQKAQRKTGDIEYSSEIIIGNSYYYLTGVMEKEEFVKIIQNVYIEKESQ